MSKPKISLLCPSYNHERFVGFFIDSVLKQTVQDWELMIVDDCSTDNNVKEIEKYKDPRIKLLKHDYNQGINAGLNDAFELAQGEYCVFIASDDMLMPNHLESSIGYLEVHPEIDVFYCSLLPIDDENHIIEGEECCFLRTQSDRAELLNEMFFNGNVLLSPGMVVRYDALLKIIPLPCGLLQYQDASLHVELMLNGLVYQSEAPLVRYRWIGGDLNVSRGEASQIRQEMEEGIHLDSFLKIQDLELFKSIFSKQLGHLGDPTVATIPYFLGRLALMSKNQERQYWGYRRVCNFMRDKVNQNLLYDLYGFQFSGYMQLVAHVYPHKKAVSNISEANLALRWKVKKYRKISLMLGGIFFIDLLIVFAYYRFHN